MQSLVSDIELRTTAHICIIAQHRWAVFLSLHTVTLLYLLPLIDYSIPTSISPNISNSTAIIVIPVRSERIMIQKKKRWTISLLFRMYINWEQRGFTLSNYLWTVKTYIYMTKSLNLLLLSHRHVLSVKWYWIKIMTGIKLHLYQISQKNAL